MERFRRGPSLAALLATLMLTCAVAHAQSDDPPARHARLGLAIAHLAETWRQSNSYRASGVMVIGVDPRGRAAKSGIVAGDVLVSVGNRTMREPSDLGFAERSLSPNQPVSVVLARDGGRLLKVFEIAPAGAAPVVAAAPEFAQEPPALEPAADPAPTPAVTPTAQASDTASLPPAATASATDAASPPPAVTGTATAAGTGAALQSPSVSSSSAASDTALPPATVTVMSAAADTTAKPAASSAPATETQPTAAPQSAASNAAPTLTAAGAAASPTAAGTTSPSLTSAGPAGSPAATGAASSSTVTPSGAGLVAVVPVAAAVAASETSSEPTAAATDSGDTPPENAEQAPADLGVVGKSLTPDLATALGAAGVEGLLVLEVTAAGPADRSGLRAGDIIVKVGEQPVADMGELQRATAAAAGSSPLKVSTLRLGKPRLELVELAGPPPTPSAPPSQEQLLMELRDEVRSLRREVQNLRKKLGK